MDLPAFLERWIPSGGSERANKDSFLKELCQVLGVPQPEPKQDDPAKNRYVFERDVRMQQPDGRPTTRFIDLYKEGCFVLEAKQSSEKGALKQGTARRATGAWENAMELARTQAQRYAEHIVAPPPFLIVCDIGLCFDLYACFDGSTRYQPFPIPEKKRLAFKDLADHAELLRRIWTDPHQLDPSRQARKVTEEVAASLAELARALEGSHPPKAVADFLMRCLFTMFAEDVGLLEEDLFTHALEKYWIPNPSSFPAAIEGLWRAMNTGDKHYGIGLPILEFNGGLFERPSALPLTEKQLRLLLAAARRNWSQVEPAIFGTLIEQALDPEERHRLGAHYTPRSYVERLVRPTVEEPIRKEWELVKAEVWRFREEKKPKEARRALRSFHARLTELRVLDPACGTGNFLYVTLDILKQIESEILADLRDLGETQQLLDLSRVSPAQLLGIEVSERARAIAELVLWLGHLQWHYRTHGRLQPPPAPVLQNLKNIECRDAVLAWDAIELVRDERGKPLSRWDGHTLKKSPVTGEKVPDDEARVAVEVYVNPRKATWPKADFVVGNPPFLGTKRMRALLGDGYVDALRSVYAGEVEDNADYVMFWWERAAEILEGQGLRRFGLITTNSITQSFNRRVVSKHLERGVRIVWAIADHPWVDVATGANVRIGMTCCTMDPSVGSRLVRVVDEQAIREGGEIADAALKTTAGSLIHADLRMGSNVSSAKPLQANADLAGMGVALHGAGFIQSPDEARRLRKGGSPSVIRPYLGGRDLLQLARERYLIDFSFLSEEEARKKNPAAFQHVVDHVLPERRLNRRDSIRTLWWRFGWERPLLQKTLKGLERYIATTETAKHLVFQFVPAGIVADHKIVVISSDDGFVLGTLSSRAHVTWALAAGGRLGVGNDPVYNKTRCFDPFPFPACSKKQQKRIRELAESLDAHRRARRAAHPELTVTGMYNVLSRLRSGEALSEKEKIIHQQGLISVLRAIHDDLDAAVFDAYGWPRELDDEPILERLVALNAARAEEERGGLVRWLRPELQNPTGATKPAQTSVGADEGEEPPSSAPTSVAPWPKTRRERIAAIRDLILASQRLWSVAEVVAALKGAKRKEVADFLDSLDGLGILTAFGESKKELRWGAARTGG